MDSFFWQLSDTFSVKHFCVGVFFLGFFFLLDTRGWVVQSNTAVSLFVMQEEVGELIWRNKTVKHKNIEVTCWKLISVFFPNWFCFIFRPTWRGRHAAAMKRNRKTLIPVILHLSESLPAVLVQRQVTLGPIGLYLIAWPNGQWIHSYMMIWGLYYLMRWNYKKTKLFENEVSDKVALVV